MPCTHGILAFTYDCIAWSRDTWLDPSMFGWIGDDEDEHWKNDFRFMRF